MLLRYILLIAVFVTMLACTRAQDEASSLKITLPLAMNKLGVQSAISSSFVAKHVVVNITASDFPQPMLFTFDSCRDCMGGGTAIPSTISLGDVPIGGGNPRLVQILAVYKNSDTGEMLFFYGAESRSLSALIEEFSTPLKQIGSNATMISGRISGRYMTGADAGPTSLVDIKFDPQITGQPPLIVETSFMVNGWFSFFGLTGVEFLYVPRATGAPLWGQRVSLDSDAFFDPGYNSGADFDHRLKAYIPAHTNYQNQGGVTVYSAEDPSIYVWGYWGSGASTKRVCTYSLAAASSKIKVYDSTPSNYPSDSYLTISRLLNSSDPVPTSAQLMDTLNPYTYLTVKGGANMTGACGSYSDTNTNEYLNFQKISQGFMDGNGNDHAAGFRGFFRMNSGAGDTLSATGDPQVLTAQLLPGVLDIFSQFKFYKRVGSEDFHMETPSCNEAVLKFNGYEAMSTSGSISADGSFSVTSDITASVATSQGVSSIYCPVMADGTVSPVGNFFSKWEHGFSGP